MISRLIDRVRLVVWALVFLAGVLLVVPLAFKFAALVSANHGIVAGIVAGLLAAAFVGFGLTALAMSRSDDLKRLPAHQRTIYIISLPGAAISIVGGMFLEVISGSIASSLAWPIAALVILAAVVVAYRLRKWALSQTDDWKE